MEPSDPTKLCLERHRLPSREIPCAECVAVTMDIEDIAKGLYDRDPAVDHNWSWDMVPEIMKDMFRNRARAIPESMKPMFRSKE